MSFGGVNSGIPNARIFQHTILEKSYDFSNPAQGNCEGHAFSTMNFVAPNGKKNQFLGLNPQKWKIPPFNPQKYLFFMPIYFGKQETFFDDRFFRG